MIEPSPLAAPLPHLRKNNNKDVGYSEQGWPKKDFVKEAGWQEVEEEHDELRLPRVSGGTDEGKMRDSL